MDLNAFKLRSKKAAIGWTLLCVYLPGALFAFWLPVDDAKWTFVLLAGLTVLGGAASVVFYNRKVPRGPLPSFAVACLTQAAAACLSLFSPGMIYTVIFGLIPGIFLALGGGMIAYVTVELVHASSGATSAR